MMAHAIPPNPYREYEGRTVEALVIGHGCAVRRHGQVHVVNHETMLIGGEVVPVWTVLDFRRSTLGSGRSAFADPCPWEVD